MNRTKIILLVMAVTLPLFVAVPVLAHQGPHVAAENTINETPAKPKTGNEGLTLEQRVQKYKDAAKTKLTNAEKLRVTGRCKAAQVKVDGLKGRVSGFETSRGEVYGKLPAHLEEFSTKLEAKNVDTTTFDTQIAELKTMVEAYQVDLAKYKESVSDLQGLDCAASPDGFKAALEASRVARAKVVTDGQAVKSYLSKTIKPTLKTLGDQVKANRESGGN